MDAYTFTHNGVTVEYYPAVVRTHLKRQRLIHGLMEAYGFTGGIAIPDEEWANIVEYATAMSQSKADAPWWVDSMAAPDTMRAAFELFMEQDPDLYAEYVLANRTTLPPKKTTVTTTEKSPV